MISKFNPSWQYWGGYYWLGKWDLAEYEVSNWASTGKGDTHNDDDCDYDVSNSD